MGKLEGVGEDGKTELWEKGGDYEERDFEISKAAACADDRNFEISKARGDGDDRDFEISKARGDGEDRDFEISKRAGDYDALICDTIPLALIFGNHELVHGHSLHVLLDDGFHMSFEEVEGVGRDCGEDILMQ